MRVDRYVLQDDDPCRQMVTLRVMDTTCPHCKEHVRFALQDEEFISEEYKFLEKVNDRLRESNTKLKQVISRLTNL